MKIRMKFAAVALSLSLGMIVGYSQIAAAQSQNTPATEQAELTLSPIVQKWFVALTNVNRRAFEKLLTDNVTIELRDLGITQTKDEFIEALDSWEDATKGAILLTRPVSSEPGMDVIETCYKFENNEQLNRETYISSNGQITSVVQELIGETCTGF